MLQDCSDVAGTKISADIAIVGAGPAGLTAAAELAQRGAAVLVLEAGGMPYDRMDRTNLVKAIRDHVSGAQSLARGAGSGEPYFPLRFSRARGLGGSSNALKSHGLRGRPLDPIDFAARFQRGWPIPYEEFAALLPDAARYCAMSLDFADRPVDWSPIPLSTSSGMAEWARLAPFRHGSRTKFAEAGRRLALRERPRVLVSAVVTGIMTDGSGRVSALEVRCPTGGSFRVTADRYVLAGGGIDNARLLLGSRSVLQLMEQAADHVGKYFMEHLHYVPAFLMPESSEAAAALRTLIGDVERPDHWLTLDDRTVAEGGLLRLAYLPVPVHEESLFPAVPAFGELVRMIPYGPYGVRGRLRQVVTAAGGVHHILRALAARWRGVPPGAAFALSVMAEQPPDSASRVTLSPRRDRLGMPLPRLHWVVEGREFEHARRSTELLGSEFDRLGLGRVVSIWDRGLMRPPVVTGGWHHMGTTRMSRSADDGVVDANCRVHGVENLYVAGSSVFPTGGYANPTLSLVALAVRLGRHLAG